MSVRVKVNGDTKYMTVDELAADGVWDHLEEKFQIKIKKKNRGKFSAAAKTAGMSTLEYANKVLSDPNASGGKKKEANFAKNAITKFGK